MTFFFKTEILVLPDWCYEKQLTEILQLYLSIFGEIFRFLFHTNHTYTLHIDMCYFDRLSRKTMRMLLVSLFSNIRAITNLDFSNSISSPYRVIEMNTG